LLRAVDRHLGEINPDHPVIASKCFGDEVLEHTRIDPFVTTCSKRGVGNPPAREALGVHP
jgi:hypothetical protein